MTSRKREHRRRWLGGVAVVALTTGWLAAAAAQPVPSGGSEPRNLVPWRAQEGTSATAPAVVAPQTPGAAPETAARPTVSLRTGEHSGYTRLVFDWATNVNYSATKDGRSVVIEFGRAADIDMEPVRRRSPQRIAGIETAAAANGITVRVTVPAEARLRHFRSGTKVVVDVLGSDGDVAATAPAAPTPGARTQAAPAPAAPAPAVPAQAARAPAPPPPAAAPAKASVESKASVAAKPPVEANAPPVAPAPAVSRPAEARAQAGSAAPAAPPVAAPAVRQAAPDNGPPTVSVAGTPETPRILVRGGGTRAAAVFQRAGFLWIVFGDALPAPIAPVPDALREAVFLAERLNAEGTVLRFRIRDGLYPALVPADRDLAVDLVPRPQPVQEPVLVRREIDPDGGRVVFALAEPGSRIVLRDPEVGDTLFVVPSRGPGGVTATREFLQFRALATVRGVAVAPFADGIDVRVVPAGVEVSRPGGLLLSVEGSPATAPDPLTPAEQPAAAPPPAAHGEADKSATRSGDPQPPPAAAPPAGGAAALYRYAAWQRAAEGDFGTVQDVLRQRLHGASDAAQPAARWDLARFYFAHGWLPEALGQMRLASEEDPLLLENPEFRAVRGAALTQLHRHEEAGRDLAFAPIANDPAVRLWRGLGAAERKDWTAAHAEFVIGRPALAEFPLRERVMLGLAATDAALVQGDMAGVEAAMNVVLKDQNGPAAAKAQIGLRVARVKAVLGDAAGAVEALDGVLAADDRPTRAEAAFAKTDLQLKAGEIDRKAAIEAMEKLRFAWRGGDFEYRLLDRVAKLHVEDRNYGAALETMREVVTYFPETPQAVETAKAMDALFRQLFLDGEADKLEPVVALALYFDFRELTPVGSDGDLMIRKLADRLASVDLLDRAAQLLEHQVRFRLTGAERARVAARLAVVHLLDRKPTDAIRVLRTSNFAQLPTALVAERRQLEARALALLERHDEALQLIREDPSRSAELLRGDIHWRRSEWKDVAASLERVLGQRWQDERPLDAVEQAQVMRLAVALVLDGNRSGLVSIRSRYLTRMQETPRANGFELLTAAIDPLQTPFRGLAQEVASLATVDAFMASYYEQSKRGDLIRTN